MAVLLSLDNLVSQITIEKPIFLQEKVEFFGGGVAPTQFTFAKGAKPNIELKSLPLFIGASRLRTTWELQESNIEAAFTLTNWGKEPAPAEQVEAEVLVSFYILANNIPIAINRSLYKLPKPTEEFNVLQKFFALDYIPLKLYILEAFTISYIPPTTPLYLQIGFQPNKEILSSGVGLFFGTYKASETGASAKVLPIGLKLLLDQEFMPAPHGQLRA